MTPFVPGIIKERKPLFSAGDSLSRLTDAELRVLVSAASKALAEQVAN